MKYRKASGLEPSATCWCRNHPCTYYLCTTQSTCHMWQPQCGYLTVNSPCCLPRAVLRPSRRALTPGHAHTLAGRATSTSTSTRGCLPGWRAAWRGPAGGNDSRATRISAHPLLWCYPCNGCNTYSDGGMENCIPAIMAALQTNRRMDACLRVDAVATFRCTNTASVTHVVTASHNDSLSQSLTHSLTHTHTLTHSLSLTP